MSFKYCISAVEESPIKKFHFSLLFVLLSGKATGVTYINHVLAQLAGDLGTVSAGVGKDFDRYSISLLYGYVPADVSGADPVETIALRQVYNFWKWERVGFHGGVNFFHVLGLQYQSANFRDTPAGYYALGSFRGLLNLGITMDLRERRQFYFEAGLNDIWMTNWVTNRKVVNAGDQVSLGLGFKQSF